ncbi:vegetative cell wall protein gp1-like [Pygocentrus nattereri]|uniref:vegetative cell wall protein gp1-like n=1 Tax=Pygocentrus nattereri TaxID=42514 RepID=UPI00189177D9|nr:vegetative cell wall protein gp1-like [Pygocentrus nattereri]
MGKVVDLKLGSSGVLSEDLTNPCRESELKHMYEKLSKNQWAKVLRQLKTGGPEMTKEKINEIRKKAEGVIQAVLRQSQHDIQNITGTMLCLTPSSQDASHKTTQYFDLAVQNLQMAIYQEKMQLYNRDKLQDVPEALYPMIDDCYKTGCLMALHNPPLLLDWDSSSQGPFPPIKIGKFVPVKEKNYDTDSLQKSSAAQPGPQIPHGNREPVKPEPLKETEEEKNGALKMTSLPAFPAAQPQIPTYKRHSSIPVKPEPLKETEEDTNGGHLRMPSLPVKSEPLKETEEDKNDALRMTSLPVSAPLQRPQPPPKNKSRPVKAEPLKETDEDKNGGHLRMTSLPAFPAAQPQIPTYKRHSSIPAQPDPHKKKEEDINTSPLISAPQQRPQPPPKHKSRTAQPDPHKEKEEDINTSPLISAPQQRPQPPPKHKSRTGKLVQQKERQQDVNTARAAPTTLPSRRQQTQRLISSSALARILIMRNHR